LGGRSSDGEDLRAFHEFLRELDKERHPKFGRLVRVQDETGKYVWVCERHYGLYEPLLQ
jgi:hypothetical protein